MKALREIFYMIAKLNAIGVIVGFGFVFGVKLALSLFN